MTRQGSGAWSGETGVAQRGAGGTRRARVSSEERDKRGAPRKKKEGQNTKAGQKEGTGPRGRREKQGANKGAKVHFVSRRETPCR